LQKGSKGCLKRLEKYQKFDCLAWASFFLSWLEENFKKGEIPLKKVEILKD
jgi:hypothetical protein